MFIVVVNKEINIAINIIDFILAPIQIIISGPRATFGSELITVRYGSIIFAIFFDINIITETIKLTIDVIKKLIIVS